MVKSKLMKDFSDTFLGQTPGPGERKLFQEVEKCEATDFNERSLAWIVECETVLQGSDYPIAVSVTFRVYDETGRLEPVVD